MCLCESNIARAYHHALSKTQTVRDLYTPNGSCEGCGQCCSRFIPMSAFDMVRLSAYVIKHGIRPHKRMDRSIDLTCPYLTTSTNRCSVYPARPEVCRAYRCDKQIWEMPAFYGAESMQEVDMLVFAKTQAAAYDDLFGTSDDEPHGMVEKVED